MPIPASESNSIKLNNLQLLANFYCWQMRKIENEQRFSNFTYPYELVNDVSVSVFVEQINYINAIS